LRVNKVEKSYSTRKGHYLENYMLMKTTIKKKKKVERPKPCDTHLKKHVIVSAFQKKYYTKTI